MAVLKKKRSPKPAVTPVASSGRSPIVDMSIPATQLPVATKSGGFKKFFKNSTVFLRELFQPVKKGDKIQTVKPSTVRFQLEEANPVGLFVDTLKTKLVCEAKLQNESQLATRMLGPLDDQGVSPYPKMASYVQTGVPQVSIMQNELEEHTRIANEQRLGEGSHIVKDINTTNNDKQPDNFDASNRRPQLAMVTVSNIAVELTAAPLAAVGAGRTKENCTTTEITTTAASVKERAEGNGPKLEATTKESEGHGTAFQPVSLGSAHVIYQPDESGSISLTQSPDSQNAAKEKARIQHEADSVIQSNSPKGKKLSSLSTKSALHNLGEYVSQQQTTTKTTNFTNNLAGLGAHFANLDIAGGISNSAYCGHDNDSTHEGYNSGSDSAYDSNEDEDMHVSVGSGGVTGPGAAIDITGREHLALNLFDSGINLHFPGFDGCEVAENAQVVVETREQMPRIKNDEIEPMTKAVVQNAMAVFKSLKEPGRDDAEVKQYATAIKRRWAHLTGTVTRGNVLRCTDDGREEYLRTKFRKHGPRLSTIVEKLAKARTPKVRITPKVRVRVVKEPHAVRRWRYLHKELQFY